MPATSPRRLDFVAMLVIASLASPATAAAYVDPVSGSVVIQVIAAAVLGAAVGVKRFWGNITDTIRRVFAKRKP